MHSSDAASANNSNIILVEDNPNDAEMALRALRRTIGSAGIRWLKDGAEALDYLLPDEAANAGRAQTMMPKLILLDLKLPRVDGHEVLEKIKQDPRTKSVPVVVLTSSREERDIERCYAAGANSYVVKPMSFDSFVETIAELGRYWTSLNQVAGL